MLTQTITAPAVSAAKVFPAPRTQGVPAVDQFSVIATCAGVIASEFSYRKDEADVQVARNLWIVMANDPRHAEDHMLLLGRNTAMEKVATFLLEMDRRLTKAGMMALPMCRRDIGDYLGLTLEAVSRALSQLSDQCILVFSTHVKSCCATASGWRT